MTRLLTIILLISLLGGTVLTSCSSYHQKLQNVGMLLESELQDQPWVKKGNQGLESIKDQYDVEIYLKENVKTELDVIKAVDELVEEGVNLIFGHSSGYGKHFIEISRDYPEVHFVYFNGSLSTNNVTSLNLNSHAMGFFSGMLAAKMSTTKQIGVIATYEWQPELEGFYEGVKYENADVNVHMNFLNARNEEEVVLDMYESMREKKIDVVYPIGDAFSNDVIEQASKDGIYAIGYVEDQLYIDNQTVLTSTIQHVDKLYEFAAKKFNSKKLQGGVLIFDFREGMISLGEFSPDVSAEFEESIKNDIDEYIETNILPNEY